jgi:uncharacterized protein YbjT (DUF2867 family)
MANDGIFILGSTGPTGEIVTRDLIAAGRHVVVMHRSDKRSEEFQSMGATVVSGDAMDRDSIFGATHFASSTCNVVLNLLGGSPFENFDTWPDFTGTVNAVDAAIAANIPTMVLVTSVGTGNSRQWVPEDSFLIPLLELKTKAEDYLTESTLNSVILKPGGLGPPDWNNAPGEILVTENHGIRGLLAREELASTIVQILKNSVEQCISKELYIVSQKLEKHAGEPDRFDI